MATTPYTTIVYALLPILSNSQYNECGETDSLCNLAGWSYCVNRRVCQDGYIPGCSLPLSSDCSSPCDLPNECTGSDQNCHTRFFDGVSQLTCDSGWRISCSLPLESHCNLACNKWDECTTADTNCFVSSGVNYCSTGYISSCSLPLSEDCILPCTQTSNFRLGIQLSDGDSGAGDILYTAYIQSVSDSWSVPVSSADCMQPLSVNLGLIADGTAPLITDDLDFRFKLLLFAIDEPAGAEVYTPWASDGGGWSTLAEPWGSVNFEYVQIGIETASLPGWRFKNIMAGLRIGEQGAETTHEILTFGPIADGATEIWSGFVSAPTQPDQMAIYLGVETPSPTNYPTISPTADPTSDPTTDPTKDPTADPTTDPTVNPTADPTVDPTRDPTSDPTRDPTADPTADPTRDPTTDPTADPTTDPTADPTSDPTRDPTADPTADPTSDPTNDPTADPTADPTQDPTIDPTTDPTRDPTADPTADPTKDPTRDPTNDPTIDPTSDPTKDPTADPTRDPTADPTRDPTNDPTLDPTSDPTAQPTTEPTTEPTHEPTVEPTVQPTLEPTVYPTGAPTQSPTLAPTMPPTTTPSFSPSTSPTRAPSQPPTAAPSQPPTPSPTPICHLAKFQAVMYKSEHDNQDDVLWGAESLTSENCRYILTMHKNGNLALYGLEAPYQDSLMASNTFVMLWETHTKLYNYSTESIPKLFMANGKMIVSEYHFKALQSRTIMLWQSNASALFTTSNEMVLTLTDSGCVELKTAEKARLMWNVCGAFSDSVDENGESDQTSTTTALPSDSSDSSVQEDPNLQQSSTTNAENWWVSILVVVLLFATVVAVFAAKRSRYGVGKSTNSSSLSQRKLSQREQTERDEESESSESTQPIEQWAKRTMPKDEDHLDVEHVSELTTLKVSIVDETNYLDFGETIAT